MSEDYWRQEQVRDAVRRLVRRHEDKTSKPRSRRPRIGMAICAGFGIFKSGDAKKRANQRGWWARIIQKQLRLCLPLIPLLVSAQTVQLGSASDPCTGGATWTNPPLRYGQSFQCDIQTATSSGFASVVVTIRQPKGVATSPDWVMLVGTTGFSTGQFSVAGATQNGTLDYLVSLPAAIDTTGKVHIAFSSIQRNAVGSTIQVTPHDSLNLTSIIWQIPSAPGPCPPYPAMGQDAAGNQFTCLQAPMYGIPPIVNSIWWRKNGQVWTQ